LDRRVRQPHARHHPPRLRSAPSATVSGNGRNRRAVVRSTRGHVVGGLDQVPESSQLTGGEGSQLSNCSNGYRRAQGVRCVGQHKRARNEPRYWMLETIREYAASQLQECGQRAAARGAHAAYSRALAQRAEAEDFGRLDREWLDRPEQEYANMLAAIDWSLAGGEPEVGLALAGALWGFFYHRDHLTTGLPTGSSAR
jgi:hypothetical protein